MTYFTLLTRDGEGMPWHPQFGDYDRRVVEDERRDMVASYRPFTLLRHTRILVTHDARQRTIDKAVDRLNHNHNEVTKLVTRW